MATYRVGTDVITDLPPDMYEAIYKLSYSHHVLPEIAPAQLKRWRAATAPWESTEPPVCFCLYKFFSYNVSSLIKQAGQCEDMSGQHKLRIERLGQFLVLCKSHIETKRAYILLVHGYLKALEDASADFLPVYRDLKEWVRHL